MEIMDDRKRVMIGDVLYQHLVQVRYVRIKRIKRFARPAVDEDVLWGSAPWS